MTVPAVVLAAGEGTRLRPLTKYRPKPMLPAANRPVLEHVFDALLDAGVDRLHAVVGYRRDRVQDYFGHEYRGLPIDYHVQRRQLGSGHAVLQAKDAVEGPFLVVNGDQITSPEIVRDVVERHAEGSDPATIALVESERAPQYGAVRLTGDRVTELVEKPETGTYRLLNAGVYAFEGKVMDEIERTSFENGELGLPETLIRLIDAGEVVRGVRTGGLWRDATYPWDLLTVTAELLDERCRAESNWEACVWVNETAAVHQEATLRPPVVVGPDAEIAPGAVVGPETAVGRNVTVGANAVVARSVLDTDTRVGANATLHDCVTGQGVHLGAATVVPGGPGSVRVASEIHEDTRLGALFGDRVRAEGCVSAVPGVLVGPDAHLGVGVTVDGVVEAAAEVVR